MKWIKKLFGIKSKPIVKNCETGWHAFGQWGEIESAVYDAGYHVYSQIQKRKCSECGIVVVRCVV